MRFVTSRASASAAIVAFILIFASSFASLPAQTAKVVALSPEDAKRIQVLYAEKASVEKMIEDFRIYVADKYISTPPDQDKRCYNSIRVDKGSQCYRDGWSWGFEYSIDFKFIVPREDPKISTDGVFGGGCVYATPSPAYVGPAAALNLNQ